jgi:flagella basal body P-ring formation protein FlgA
MIIRWTVLGLAAGALMLAASPSLAGQKVNLRSELSSPGSLVTFDDLFEDPGQARQVIVATRNQPNATLFLDAQAVQQLAAQYGLNWDNATGLRRLVVRPQSPPDQFAVRRDAKLSPAVVPVVRMAPNPALISAALIIQKGDLVQVAYRDQGLLVSIQGRALGAAAVGQTLSVLNPGSKRTIDAIAAGPGQAVTGPDMGALQSQTDAPRHIALLP